MSRIKGGRWRVPPKPSNPALRIIRGLLRIAEAAMPDTYFQTDSRVKAAQKYLKEHKR